ncbi:MAG: type II secretion system F family protein [Sedimentisphaerales bacterium]|nr:type II secretion system F family protein [Sedimentisphaerales bacterium]
MIVTYEALDRSGLLVRDTLALDEGDDAVVELRRRGLVPVRVQADGPSLRRRLTGLSSRVRDWGGSQADPRRARRKELPLFTEQMAILLETGTPVAPSLAALERQVTTRHWQALVRQLRRQVEEGGSLASAVTSYPEVFDPVYGSMICAGEASGKLPLILGRLALLSRQADRVRQKVVSALIYPTLLTGIAFSVVNVLIFFVLPRFAGIFTEMEVKLPRSTTTLLAVSHGIRGNMLIVLSATAAAVAGLVLWNKSRAGVRLRQRAVLRLPIMGPLVRSLILARLFRLIGLLLESSVPLLDALELTKTSTRNYLYVQLLERMYQSVLNGRTMYEVMLHSRLVPASLAQMVHTGEANAQIGRVMTLLADHLDDQNETRIGMLTSIMEPVILIIMGLVIGMVAISLVLPMFDLSRISG